MTLADLRRVERKLLWLPLIFVSLPIFFGFPFGFYVLLRFVVCGVLGFLAHSYFRLKRIGDAWLLGSIAVFLTLFFRFN